MTPVQELADAFGIELTRPTSDGSFAATFLRNGLTLDRNAVEREAVAAGRALVAKHPKIDTVVLECTNLPPYKAALKAALGLPVLDVLDLLADFHARLDA